MFLYTRFPDYFYRCLISLVEHDKDIEISIIRYDNDEDMPYSIHNSERIFIYNYCDFKSSNSLVEFSRQNNINWIYTCTWSDSKYFGAIQILSKEIVTVLGMDNPWKGSVRQNIGALYFRLTFLRHFDYIWVPGKSQATFAKKLGFKDKMVIKDLYCANVTKPLDSLSLEVLTPGNIKRRLIFVGRLVEYKQPLLLAKVFDEMVKEGSADDWELEFVGEGPLKKQIEQLASAKIITSGFCPPDQLVHKFNTASAFCLPSINEHWGLVVHEAALAGLPMVLSDTVFAAERFLLDGVNGFICKSGSYVDLKRQLERLFELDESSLKSFASKSRLLGNELTHQQWIKSIKLTFVKDYEQNTCFR